MKTKEKFSTMHTVSEFFSQSCDSNQILIVITIFLLIWYQTEFHWYQSEKCNYNHNLVWFNEFQKKIYFFFFWENINFFSTEVFRAFLWEVGSFTVKLFSDDGTVILVIIRKAIITKCIRKVLFNTFNGTWSQQTIHYMFVPIEQGFIYCSNLLKQYFI